MKAVTAMVALDDDVDPAVVEAALASSQSVQVLGYVHGLEEDAESLDDTSFDALVLACNASKEAALSLIRSSAASHPERPVVVLSPSGENGFVGRVFEAGADDLVELPAAQSPDQAGQLAEHVGFTLQKAVARKSGATASSATGDGRLICVLGPKGGIGKTLTAANLAAGLANAGHSVTVVDLDLQFGDVGLSLGLAPERTIYDLVRSGGSLDEQKLEAYLTEHESGARVLLAPVRPDQAGAVTTDFLALAYPMLRSLSDCVIVDTPPGFTPEVITSIDSSSDICMVGMLDSLSLKNTKLGLETLELMGYDEERVRLVLNRADSRVGITPGDVREIVGREPDVLIPSDRDVARSVNEGAPIVLSHPRSEAAKAFRRLAVLFGSAPGGVPSQNGSGRRFRLRRR